MTLVVDWEDDVVFLGVHILLAFIIGIFFMDDNFIIVACKFDANEYID